jgi:hypothetical protein
LSARDAPAAQGQQPEAKTAKDKTRDKNVTRPLGPDVVDDKGQRVPFSRRGWELQDSDDDGKTTTVPRASRPAKPGLPMPLTIVEDDYVIVDNGAANPGELAIGRVRKVDDELVEVHWHAERCERANTDADVVAHLGERRRDAAHQRPADARQDGRDLRGLQEPSTICLQGARPRRAAARRGAGLLGEGTIILTTE